MVRKPARFRKEIILGRSDYDSSSDEELDQNFEIPQRRTRTGKKEITGGFKRIMF